MLRGALPGERHLSGAQETSASEPSVLALIPSLPACQGKACAGECPESLLLCFEITAMAFPFPDLKMSHLVMMNDVRLNTFLLPRNTPYRNLYFLVPEKHCVWHVLAIVLMETFASHLHGELVTCDANDLG